MATKDIQRDSGERMSQARYTELKAMLDALRFDATGDRAVRRAG